MIFVVVYGFDVGIAISLFTIADSHQGLAPWRVVTTILHLLTEKKKHKPNLFLLTCINYLSMQGTPRLVSAMKGTRAKQGIMTKLSVSWAPDVYDPPVTSDSHTVRGHQRSSRKGHYKYKPSKSSSSSSRNTSGSKKDKKHSRHSSNSSKKDRKHSSRSTSTSGSNRTDTSSSHYRKPYSGVEISSGRTVTCVPESAKVSSLVLAETAVLPEIVSVLKTTEPIKCATSCGKEKPFALLPRQFSPGRYKGMFSFWSQNQLA